MSRQQTVSVWDAPTRLFHWLLVLLILGGWASYEFSNQVGDPTMLWHRLNGYAVVVLLLWRLIWGFIGSPASRFARFAAAPWTAAGYAMNLMRGRERHYLGHNPLGGYMVLALMLLVAIQATLGLFATEHNFIMWGPLSNTVSPGLSETLTEWHEEVFDILLVFIGLHVAANILYRIIKKDRLIEAMVTGSKPAGDYADRSVALENGTTPAIWLRAAISLVLAVGIFVGVVAAAGGKLFP